ncbi:hypothetical protein [Bryobacter aggregatus]|nr:hypothetical protein [Bryobacter aggregatus]
MDSLREVFHGLRSLAKGRPISYDLPALIRAQVFEAMVHDLREVL